MKRLIELLKMILYLGVTIISYLGVNQLLIITKDIQISFPEVWFSNWWTNEISVEAKGKENDWSNKEVYIEVIDDYLAEKNSPMVGSGKDFVFYAQKFNLPRYLMVAIAGAESNFGKEGYATENSYNAVGLGVHEGRKYNSWREGIGDMAYVLRNYYFDEGKEDSVEIQNKWAPRCIDNNSCDNSWAKNVDFFTLQLENIERNKMKGEI